MTRRILVTGASGFVGTYLTAALRERPDSSVIGTSPVANASGRSDDMPADLLDRAATHDLIDRAKPDIIVHLAGQSSVARGYADERQTWSVNVLGAVHMAEAIARHAPDATLLFVSSAEVYGASFRGGIVTEASALKPLNAYARSKALAETIFDEMLPQTCRVVTVRPFNHTGPGQREDFVLPSFAGQIARIEAGLQASKMAVGNLDARRDFLDVRDVVEAYVGLIERAAALPMRTTVNVASGHSSPIRELLDALLALARVPIEVVVDVARLRPAEIPMAQADASLIGRLTGWAPKHDMSETLVSLLDDARLRASAGRHEANP